MFFAWFDYIERRKQRMKGDSDNSDDDEEDDDDFFRNDPYGDDGDGDGERSGAKSSQIVVPVRRPARGMRAFTSKEAPIDEEEEDSK